jgi:hypothetical protein
MSNPLFKVAIVAFSVPKEEKESSDQDRAPEEDRLPREPKKHLFTILSVFQS